MAFTFTVEDGTVVAGANSYVTVAEADSYFEIDLRLDPAWSALTDPNKEKLLATATRWLDESYQWFGARTQLADPDATPPVVAQPLMWPRKGMRDSEGNCIADSVIPAELRKAAAYMALWLYTNDADEVLEGGGVKRFRNDLIEIEWQDAWQGSAQAPFLTRLLSAFGFGPGERGFKPIIRK